jgi:hypothetical protein
MIISSSLTSDFAFPFFLRVYNYLAGLIRLSKANLKRSTANLVILGNQTIDKMPVFDFKRYHIRSMNATDAEKLEINLELKDLYESLSDDDKKIFNIELQRFLTTEVSRIKSDYDSIHGLNQPN